MSTVISVIAQKGGVGKTTTSIHLGASFATQKKKVLLVDFDSQRNLSTGVDIPKDYPYTVFDFLNDTGDFQVEEISKNLYVLCGDKRLKDLELEPYGLRDRLKIIDEYYKFDYIIIDCPPEPISNKINMGKVGLLSSDYVISPFQADLFSSDGIMELLPEIGKIQEKENKKLEFLGFFFNHVDTRHKRYKKYHAKALEEAGDYFFKTHISQDMTFYHAMEAGQTVFQYDPNSRASQDLKYLSKEIIKKIKENEKQ